MDYEKKYNEAQKWIESIYSELSHEHQMEAEAFFPELKCDDEKIRKEIIKCVKNYGPSSANPQLFKNMLAWLEKQEGCEHIKKDWLEHIKQSWYKEGFIDGKYSGGTSKEWTINDAAIFKEIIDFLENGTEKLQHDLTKYANWLKIQFTPIEKQGEQKSADKIEPKFHEGEWVVISTSGGEKVVQIDSIEHFKSGEPMYITSEGRWFGNGTKARILTDKDMETITIPERSTIVKKIKSWSEEDEEHTHSLLDRLEGMCKKGSTFITTRFAVSQDIDWLKSLKERYTWKPSDEQMKALHDLNLTGNISYAGQGQVLIELYNDLKKLTE